MFARRHQAGRQAAAAPRGAPPAERGGELADRGAVLTSTIMNVGEICIREVVIVRADEPLLTAARLMRDFGVGDVGRTRR